jgi:glyoxylase-like metal-dependent hydrolase (beta-lactamase superfamily II)
MRKFHSPIRRVAALALATSTMAGVSAASAAAPVSWDTLARGFVAESFLPSGFPVGPTGFSSPNPWGQYSAYLMATNEKGQRTWRIENFLPNQNLAGQSYAQGSTMYLLEGSQRALLVDTAQNTVDVPLVAGQPDLVTIAKHLLGHTNTGLVKANPVDFVVAITHNHGDHTGKNAAMAPRTIYFPASDYPANAPANYRLIKEGGGPTPRGEAVGSLDLGDRLIEAIDIPEHTAGSTAYLDRENLIVATGDGIGSGFGVYAQGGPLTLYSQSVRHLQEVIASYPEMAVLPAHSYQFRVGDRKLAPISGRPTDKAYVDDQVTDAAGLLSGDVVGEPYRAGGRGTTLGFSGSAGIVYSLGTLYPGGIFGGQTDPNAFHAIAIPGTWTMDPAVDATFPALDNVKTGFYLIRDGANNTLYLIKGSTKALLVGTGTGTPGLAAFVGRLTGDLPLEVIVTSNDRVQTGGLAQFTGRVIHVPRGAGLAGHAVASGDTIDLGVDAAGRPAQIEVQSLSGHSKTGITLLSVSDRVLLSGDALGEQFNGGGLILHDTLPDFDAALRAWRPKTDGRYDSVYTAHNFQWYTSPAFVDQVQQAVTRGLELGDAATIPSVRPAGYRMIRSTGAADVVASIVLAEYAETNVPGTVGGSVPATLSLTLGTPASFEAFTPGVARDYTASTTATVISTAGDATLSVADPSSANTGHLVNGAFALPQALQAGTGGVFAPVGGSAAPTAVKTWSAPTSNEAVPVMFRQPIAANDALRTGAYSKTLTFTLSTTAP